MTGDLKPPQIFLSLAHPCSYLPERTARELFLDPNHLLDSGQYASFVRLGFRRSGDFVYRPHCGLCHACVPVRVPVDRFHPARGQRRVWKSNRDLAVTARPAVYDQEHFDLYQRYQATRHTGGGLDDPDPEKYINFLAAQRISTVFFEFRQAQKLLAVAVTDTLPDGLSAVYTFFEPEEARRSLGVYSVLWQIEQAKARSLPRLYLGYWIKECPKMSYKVNYRPLEMFLDGQWILQEDPRNV